VYVAPIRLGLAVVWFFAARLVGLERASDVLAFAATLPSTVGVSVLTKTKQVYRR
jgi:hypothetical protein